MTESILHLSRFHNVSRPHVAYIAKNHSVGFDVIYHGRGKVSFKIEYFHGLPGNMEKTPPVTFDSLTIEELRFIADREEGSCGRVRIDLQERSSCVTLHHNDDEGVSSKMSIPKAFFWKLQRLIWKELSDCFTMQKYTNPGECVAAIEDSYAQKALAITYLREAYENEISQAIDEIENTVEGDFAQLAAISIIDHRALASRVLKTVTTEDVNNFLRFTGYRIESKDPLEPLIKTLLIDQNNVLEEVVGRQTALASATYFRHVLHCNQERETSGRWLCEDKHRYTM